MPKDQNRGFNPLDILATAAALQSGDKNTPAQTVHDMTQKTEASVSGSKDGASEKQDVNKSSSSTMEIRKIKVVTVCSDLEKMFDEHNYGNARKISIKPSGSCSTDDLTKERKVIVTVVDKSGDHRVVKTFNSATLSADSKGADKPSSGTADSSGEHSVTKPAESIKIPRGEELVNNSAFVQTDAEGDNCVIPQVNKDLPGQVQLLTSTTQVNSDKTKPEDITQPTCTSAGLINTTSNCQDGTDLTQNKSSSDTCTEGDKQKVDILTAANAGQLLSTEADVNMGQKLKVNTDVKLSDIQTKESDTQCDVADDKSYAAESDVNLIQKAFKCSVDNIENMENQVSNKTPEITASQSCADVQLSQTEMPVANIGGVSGDKSISTEKGENSDYDSMLSDGERINTLNSRRVGSCADMISDIKDSGEKNLKLQLSSVDSTMGSCDHGHTSSELMSPLGKYSSSMDCPVCLQNLDGSWHYEGESGRSDVRLSIDLDSPKSERHEGRCDVNGKVAASDTDVEDVGDIKGAKSTDNSQTGSESSGGSGNDRSCYFDDHCYADVSSQKRKERGSQSSTEDEAPGSSNSDLSQDSGIGDVSQSPSTKEIHVDVCGLSDSGSKASLSIGGKPVLLADSSLLPLLQMKCSKEGLVGLSEINRTRDAIIALFQSSDGNTIQAIKQSQLSPITSPPPPKKDTSPRFGKYRIGTFASVSNSTIGLESPKKQNAAKGRNAKSLLTNLPLTVSQGKSREEGIQTEGKTQPSSYGRKSYKSHVDHDHDYCLSSEPETVTYKSGRDGSAKHSGRAKDKKGDGSEKKSKKASISDVDRADFDDSMDSFTFEDSSQPSSPNVNQPHGTRQKVKSSDKVADYVKSGCSDSKLKITGSFQDDYIYFLNTKSRSRRRGVSQDAPVAATSDKILLPLPKPGDIVVPHLTDADLEAIKQGHPSAAKPMQRYPVTSASNTTHTARSDGSNSLASTSTKHQGEVSDEESKIINTILSMENGELPSSQGSVDAPNFLEGGILSGPSGDGLLSNINLTPEQMEIIYHAMDEVQSLSPDVSSVDSRFDMDDALSMDGAGDASASQCNSDASVNNDAKGFMTSSASSVSVTSSADVKVTEKTTSAENVTSPTTTNVENKTVAIVTGTGDSSKGQTVASTSLGPGVVNSMPDISFTSLDKSSLEIFGNDLKLFPEASVEAPAPPLAQENNNRGDAPSGFNNSDNSAPWIVTVSMYWNDLPAIMIDKLPYVRLVDIHKQILPAKDTGILKKRCQLLGIPVLNCTEMQRYFLVQYGKAFNSKSTLIIGKDDAKSLIGYYVNPVPVPHRVREHKAVDKSNDRDSSAECQPARTPKWTPNLKQKVEISDSARKNSVPSQDEVDSIQQSTPSTETKPLPEQSVIPPILKPDPRVVPSTVAAEPAKTSSRTRRKKINFLEMLKGDSNNNTPCDVSAIENTSEQIVKTERQVKPAKAKDRKSSPESRNKGHESAAGQDENHTRDEKLNKQRVPTDEGVQAEINHCIGESENDISTSSKRKAKFDLDLENSQSAKKLCTEKGKRLSPLKVKWTMFNKKNTKRSGKSDTRSESKEILAVVHKDMSPKNGQRGRMQAGNVFIDLYEGPNVPCVRCCTCKKLFSVDNFLKHLHEIGGSGKLLVVTQPQTFALRDAHPSDSQKKLWGSFQKRRRLYSAEIRAKNVIPTEVKKNVAVDEGLVTKIQSSLMKNRNVRISARKRKPKQLHPIENYSFAKSNVTNQEQVDTVSVVNDAAADSLPTSSKMARILPNLSANIVDSTGRNSEERDRASTSSESVVTLANGPEVISFTALENGLDV